MELNDQDWKLLEKWLADPSFINWATNADPEDRAKWEHYFNAHHEYWELAKVGRMHVVGVPFTRAEPQGPGVTRALDRLQVRLDQRQRKNSRSRWPRWRVAAAIALLLTCLGIGYFGFLHDTKVVLATSFGEKLESRLPDGSLVMLNSDSRLVYRLRDPRRVYLSGEAYFAVKRKPETGEEFQVVTPDLKVTVLGTSFNVNTRNEKTKVYLEEGRVDLTTDDPDLAVIPMAPGDLVTYSKKRGALEERREQVSALETASWKDGTLIFNETPLPKALHEIEDIYGIEFVFHSEQIAEEVISGGVPITNLEVTLQILREVHGLAIIREGERYRLAKHSE